MKRIVKFSGCLLVSTICYVAPVHAQATRTWVSGVGDDVNPCSRTAPCKTFAGAISKTSAGGEINCLDPGGYGTLTITKSITIDCAGTIGSVLASGTNGFNINDSASGFPGTIRVILRNLSINGAQSGAQNASGNPGSGLVGINFTSGASLFVENVIIQNFNAGTATGIRFAPSSPARLFVDNSELASNGAGGGGGAILVAPSGNSGSATAMVQNTRMFNNAFHSIRVDTAGNIGGGANVTVDNSTMSLSVDGVVVNQPVGTSAATVMIGNSTITNNQTHGLTASGASARIRIGNSTITNSGTAALQSGGAIINTYGTNQINGNSVSDGTFTLPAIPPS
jgi:hypothetical protein